MVVIVLDFGGVGYGLGSCACSCWWTSVMVVLVMLVFMVAGGWMLIYSGLGVCGSDRRGWCLVVVVLIVLFNGW
jgi:hypothetical protein